MNSHPALSFHRSILEDTIAPYHMVAAEGLHDGGLVQELDSLPQVGRLVHRLHRYTGFPFTLDDVLRDALVHHAEGALTQFSQNGDLFSSYLPLVLLVHCMAHFQEYVTHVAL